MALRRERSSPLLSVLLAGDQVEDFFSFATSCSETGQLCLRSSTVLPRCRKRKPCCGGATPGWSGSNMRWEMLLRSCLRSFCSPGVGCLSSCSPNSQMRKPSPRLSRREPGTVLRNRSAMELTCCAPSAARDATEAEFGGRLIAQAFLRGPAIRRYHHDY